MPSGHLNKHSRNRLSHRCLTIIEVIHLFEAFSGLCPKNLGGIEARQKEKAYGKICIILNCVSYCVTQFEL